LQVKPASAYAEGSGETAPKLSEGGAMLHQFRVRRTLHFNAKV